MLKRYRTSRGFGVHSPLAFELITGVLCDSSPCYYATPSLPHAAARRWLRVLARFNPRQVAVSGGELPYGMPQALAAAGVALAPGSDAPMRIELAPARLTAPRRGVTMVLGMTRDEFRAAASALPDHGVMTFSGTDEHYIVSRPDLPRQHFDINLK